MQNQTRKLLLFALFWAVKSTLRDISASSSNHTQHGVEEAIM